jgi:hypothetical protein
MLHSWKLPRSALDTFSAWAVSHASSKLFARRNPLTLREINLVVPSGFGSCRSFPKTLLVRRLVVFKTGAFRVVDCDSCDGFTGTSWAGAFCCGCPVLDWMIR